MAWRGKFKPKNPGKYKGDPNGIVYRSSLEFKVMRRLDEAPNVVWWSSEEVVVPYYDPVKARPRRYFPDMVYCRVNRDGTRTTVMVEVKMLVETKAPVHKKGKKRARVITEELTFQTNSAKWKAAREFCRKQGWEFAFMTEKEIGKTY